VLNSSFNVWLTTRNTQHRIICTITKIPAAFRAYCPFAEHLAEVYQHVNECKSI